MLAYAIEVASDSKIFDTVMVSKTGEKHSIRCVVFTHVFLF
jgi:CMP-N-acetylneuraminic acid synthetase